MELVGVEPDELRHEDEGNRFLPNNFRWNVIKYNAGLWRHIPEQGTFDS
jgi:hypothetical protein